LCLRRTDPDSPRRGTLPAIPYTVPTEQPRGFNASTCAPGASTFGKAMADKTADRKARRREDAKKYWGT
jgi:hypothetical protein